MEVERQTDIDEQGGISSEQQTSNVDIEIGPQIGKANAGEAVKENPNATPNAPPTDNIHRNIIFSPTLFSKLSSEKERTAKLTVIAQIQERSPGAKELV